MSCPLDVSLYGSAAARDPFDTAAQASVRASSVPNIWSQALFCAVNVNSTSFCALAPASGPRAAPCNGLATIAQQDRRTAQAVGSTQDVLIRSAHALAPTTNVLITLGQADAPTTNVLITLGQADAPTSSVLNTMAQADAPTASVLIAMAQADAPTTNVLITLGQADAPTASVLIAPGQADAPMNSVLNTMAQVVAPTTSVPIAMGQADAPTTSVPIAMAQEGCPALVSLCECVERLLVVGSVWFIQAATMGIGRWPGGPSCNRTGIGGPSCGFQLGVLGSRRPTSQYGGSPNTRARCSMSAINFAAGGNSRSIRSQPSDALVTTGRTTNEHAVIFGERFPRAPHPRQ